MNRSGVDVKAIKQLVADIRTIIERAYREGYRDGMDGEFVGIPLDADEGWDQSSAKDDAEKIGSLGGPPPAVAPEPKIVERVYSKDEGPMSEITVGPVSQARFGAPQRCPKCGGQLAQNFGVEISDDGTRRPFVEESTARCRDCGTSFKVDPSK